MTEVIPIETFMSWIVYFINIYEIFMTFMVLRDRLRSKKS